jgi:hypothetical protein
MKQSYQLEKKHIVVLFDRGVKINQIIEGEFNIQRVFQEEVTDIINMTFT